MLESREGQWDAVLGGWLSGWDLRLRNHLVDRERRLGGDLHDDELWRDIGLGWRIEYRCRGRGFKLRQR